MWYILKSCNIGGLIHGEALVHTGQVARSSLLSKQRMSLEEFKAAIQTVELPSREQGYAKFSE